MGRSGDGRAAGEAQWMRAPRGARHKARTIREKMRPLVRLRAGMGRAAMPVRQFAQRAEGAARSLECVPKRTQPPDRARAEGRRLRAAMDAGQAQEHCAALSCNAADYEAGLEGWI